MVWEMSADGVTGRPLRCHSGTNKFGCVAFDQRGSRLAAGHHHVQESHTDGKTGARWWLIDPKTFDPIVPAIGTDWHVREIAFSPDGHKVAAGCGWFYGGGCVTVYDIRANGT
jgi:hypothetical protein